MSTDDSVRRAADVLGIHLVRAMAKEAVRRAPTALGDLRARASE